MLIIYRTTGQIHCKEEHAEKKEYILLVIDMIWKRRSTTLPSFACMWMFFMVELVSRDVKTWEGSKRLGENNSVMQILHKCRQLAPDDKAILQLSFMTSLHMKDGRYRNT
jgi:hypothetical protein